MTIFDRIIEYGILFLIVFTPLAFGSVHYWAYTTMELTVFFLIIIWAIKQIITYRQPETPDPDRRAGRTRAGRNSERRTPNSELANPEPEIRNTRRSTRNTQHATRNAEFNRFGLVKTPLNIPIILFMALILFQLIPLPSGLLKSLSPNTHYLYSLTQPGSVIGNSKLRTPNSELPHLQPETHNLQPDTRNPLPATRNSPVRNSELRTLNSELLSPISIYSYASKAELFKILAYIGMFFLITNTPGIRIKRIVVVIISVGFSISLLGIMQKFTGTKDMYWVVKASRSTLFGPFENRNHFAGYIGMVIPLALGLLVSRFASAAFSRHAARRSIVAKFQSHFFANLLLTFVIVIMISSIFLSLSRGGIISFFVVVVAFCTLVGLAKLRGVMGRGLKIIVSVLVITFVFLMWLGLDPVLDRLSNISSPPRYEVYENTINIAKDFPLLGTGVGTFQYIYPGYKTLQDQLYYDHAHNDYLELISDSGLVGFVIVLSGLIMFFWKTLVKWWERRYYYAKGVTLGGVCSVIAILAHSFTDFNLHIPANALFLSIILGLIHNVVNLKSKSRYK